METPNVDRILEILLKKSQVEKPTELENQSRVFEVSRSMVLKFSDFRMPLTIMVYNSLWFVYLLC